jgi:poly-gamma-glutamate synthesis protein (capsule biosynthesis protein)
VHGCGDLINDYEGIAGFEEYRDDLRLLYLPTLDPVTHELRELRMVPLQARRMRLQLATSSDAEWLRAVLHRTCRRFGSRVALGPDGGLMLRSA